jgi:hypothetical protein
MEKGKVESLTGRLETTEDMSDAFYSVLVNKPETSMNLVFLFALLVVIMISLGIKNIFLQILFNSLIILAAVLLSEYLFWNWWEDLKIAALNEKDQRWINDHDGGTIFVVLSTFLKAFVCLAIATFISFLKWKKEKVKLTGNKF